MSSVSASRYRKRPPRSEVRLPNFRARRTVRSRSARLAAGSDAIRAHTAFRLSRFHIALARESLRPWDVR